MKITIHDIRCEGWDKEKDDRCNVLFDFNCDFNKDVYIRCGEYVCEGVDVMYAVCPVCGYDNWISLED